MSRRRLSSSKQSNSRFGHGATYSRERITAVAVVNQSKLSSLLFSLVIYAAPREHAEYQYCSFISDGHSVSSHSMFDRKDSRRPAEPTNCPASQPAGQSTERASERATTRPFVDLSAPQLVPSSIWPRTIHSQTLSRTHGLAHSIYATPVESFILKKKEREEKKKLLCQGSQESFSSNGFIVVYRLATCVNVIHCEPPRLEKEKRSSSGARVSLFPRLCLLQGSGSR